MAARHRASRSPHPARRRGTASDAARRFDDFVATVDSYADGIAWLCSRLIWHSTRVLLFGVFMYIGIRVGLAYQDGWRPDVVVVEIYRGLLLDHPAADQLDAGPVTPATVYMAIGGALTGTWTGVSRIVTRRRRQKEAMK